jgi:hypothetical protein
MVFCKPPTARLGFEVVLTLTTEISILIYAKSDAGIFLQRTTIRSLVNGSSRSQLVTLLHALGGGGGAEKGFLVQRDDKKNLLIYSKIKLLIVCARTYSILSS